MKSVLNAEIKEELEMKKLEVFFDYACPFCLKGYNSLMALLPAHPELTISWCPCEAHPRPEQHGPHSDLCIQGMYYVMAHGGDLDAYHERMFRAALTDRINIEDAAVLAAYVKDLVDEKAFLDALKSGLYKEIQEKGNDYAYTDSGVWAVPSFRMNGKKLDAVEGVGVTKEALDQFLKEQ